MMLGKYAIQSQIKDPVLLASQPNSEKHQYGLKVSICSATMPEPCFSADVLRLAIHALSACDNPSRVKFLAGVRQAGGNTAAPSITGGKGVSWLYGEARFFFFYVKRGLSQQSEKF